VALLFVIFAMLFSGLLSTLAKWSPRGKRSMERYHHALEVLGGLSEHNQATPTPGGEPQPAPDRGTPGDGPDSIAREPASAPREIVPPQQIVTPQHFQSERPTLIFVDDSVADHAPPEIRKRRPLLRAPARPRLLLVGGATLVVLGAILGLVLSSSPSTRPNSSRHLSATPSTTQRNRAVAPGARPDGTSTSTSTTTTTTSTTVPLTSGGPVIASVSPSVAVAGGTVTITGRGFVGPGGVVYATFNGQPAPTHCPSEQQCIATVPQGLPKTVVVRLRTSNHQSNEISVSYNR
jgi:hypothetical protein